MSETATRLKNTRRTRRKRRVRAKISGTAERPRISVVRSNRGISAQVIDDVAGKTLASVNWTEADLRKLRASSRRPRPAKCWPSESRPLALTAPYSTATDFCTTDVSRHSRKASAKAD